MLAEFDPVTVPCSRHLAHASVLYVGLLLDGYLPEPAGPSVRDERVLAWSRYAYHAASRLGRQRLWQHAADRHAEVLSEHGLHGQAVGVYRALHRAHHQLGHRDRAALARRNIAVQLRDDGQCAAAFGEIGDALDACTDPSAMPTAAVLRSFLQQLACCRRAGLARHLLPGYRHLYGAVNEGLLFMTTFGLAELVDDHQQVCQFRHERHYGPRPSTMNQWRKLFIAAFGPAPAPPAEAPKQPAASPAEAPTGPAQQDTP
ncbi:hypothetical protein ACFY36_51135 [Actinoplanes sp. NPDC000266]